MANIPVERTSGAPGWIWWVVGLAALVILFLLLSRGCQDPATDPYAGDTTGVEGYGPAATDTMGGAGSAARGDTITSITQLISLGDDAIGRPVRLSGVQVPSMAGDSTFFVGESPNRVLVLLENLGEDATGARGTDGRYRVDSGDTLDLRGRAVELTDEEASRYNAERRTGQRPYMIRVDRITSGAVRN